MDAQRRTGAELTADAISRCVGDTIFALPGSHIGGVLDACRRLGMRVVNVRHEENAVLMAEGWALVTGQPGLALVTAGPGLTNALAGMAESRRHRIPRRVHATTRRRASHQVRWSKLLASPESAIARAALG